MTILLACAGMLQAAEPDEVSAWPEYAKAVPQGLDVQEIPKAWDLPGLAALPDEGRRRQREMEIHAAMTALGMPPVPDGEWVADHQGLLFRNREEGGFDVYLRMDPATLEITHASFISEQSFAGIRQLNTTQAVLDYATRVHRAICGRAPLGQHSFASRDGRGLLRFGRETVSWVTTVDELWLGQGSVEVKRLDDGHHQLTVLPAVTENQIRDAEEFLIRHPVMVSEREAMAVVMKTWNACSRLPEVYKDQAIHATCRRVIITPRVARSLAYMTADRLLWISPRIPVAERPPYGYEVTINWGLFRVGAEMDWRTGEILQLWQGRMNW